MQPTFHLTTLSAEEITARIDQLSDVLADCVNGGASVSFMLPFQQDTARVFWQKMSNSVALGERVVLAAVDEADVIIGTVQLIIDLPENQPHRGEVAKLLVHSRGRRQGIALALMGELENIAREGGKRLLVLDTATGSGAEQFYQRCGWQKAGVIPDFALMPDGEVCSTTLFYKSL
ncbi:GNAT family N-acetyltransferase [uncultured Pluralibacter sp.]|uniref:GNAT family N-acetyltransferase n=1 Tax=uncultured Pluralibacter sp. TaxID=1490864 RepID=UPI00262C1A4C|nr:GNAT family N-acetyltransferase [uncultured Pluralibacter sp.]